MRRLLLAGAAALALSGCVSGVPSDREFGPEAPFALAVIEAEPAAPVLRPGGTYRLIAVPFAPETGKFTSSPLGGQAQFEDMGASERRYYVGRLNPGTHAFMKLEHNQRWNACFNGGTQQLTVRPGQVLFLGRLDPRPALAAVAASTPSTSSGAPYTAFDQRLTLTPPDALPGWQVGGFGVPSAAVSRPRLVGASGGAAPRDLRAVAQLHGRAGVRIGSFDSAEIVGTQTARVSPPGLSRLVT